MPRIITVDPTGTISRIVRSAMDLLDLSIIQVDVPTGTDALEELNRPANLVVSAFELDDNMKGFEFALRVKQVANQTSVLILGDIDDPDDLDDETALDSPFVYMSRPVDIHRFLRVLMAGLESPEAMLNAMSGGVKSTSGEPSGAVDLGPVPSLDVNAARRIIDALLTDLGAMAILMANRTGESLVEAGAIGYLDREELASAIMPVMQANIGVKDLVGGELSTVQLYDGEDYDIFVLTVGLHHFICIVFDGQMGAKQFGMVNRYGRQAVQDLIALLGANAFFIQPQPKKEEPARRRTTTVKRHAEPDEPIQLAPAEIGVNELMAEPEPEPVLQQLEPVADLDVDDLFGSDVDVDESLFDLDNIEDLAKSSQSSKSVIDWDQAQQLGILRNN